MQKRLTTIELHDLHFSAGHFTIFSETKREPLHGHNYQIYVSLTHWLNENGLTFDYRIYKKQIRDLYKTLDHTFLIPTNSPYLDIKEEGEYCHVYFNNEKIPFLKKDITLMPLANITVEELSNWFLEKLTANQTQLTEHRLQRIEVKIFSTPRQSGCAVWTAENNFL